jgi:hypothetical protein
MNRDRLEREVWALTMQSKWRPELQRLSIQKQSNLGRLQEWLHWIE